MTRAVAAILNKKTNILVHDLAGNLRDLRC